MLLKIQFQNIPIDMIGGTSIGSLMGALWAQTRDIEIMKKRAKKFSGNMSQLWRKIIDLTRVSDKILRVL